MAQSSRPQCFEVIIYIVQIDIVFISIHIQLFFKKGSLSFLVGMLQSRTSGSRHFPCCTSQERLKTRDDKFTLPSVLKLPILIGQSPPGSYHAAPIFLLPFSNLWSSTLACPLPNQKANRLWQSRTTKYSNSQTFSHLHIFKFQDQTV